MSITGMVEPLGLFTHAQYAAITQLIDHAVELAVDDVEAGISELRDEISTLHGEISELRETSLVEAQHAVEQHERDYDHEA